MRSFGSGKCVICACVATLTWAAVLASPAVADLRGKLPETSVLYIEFAGGQACSQANATTPFGKILREPGMDKLTTALWSAARTAIMKEASGQGAEELAGVIEPMVLALWKSGFAIDVAGVTVGENGPTGSVVIASPLGESADAFVQGFEKLLQMAPMIPPPVEQQVDGHAFKAINLPMPFVPPISYGVVDGMFVLTLGAETPKMILDASSGAAPNLASNVRLKRALERCGESEGTTICAIHVDVAEALSQGKALFSAMSNGQEPPPMVTSLLEELGVNGLQSFTATSRIADGGFRNSAFIATEGPRKGVLKLLEQKPLTDDDMVWMPKDATMATAFNFSLAAAYDEVVRVLGMLPIPVKPQFDEAMAEFEKNTGLKLREDVLSVLDDGVVIYDAPSGGGFVISGLTLVVEVTDAQAADALIRKAADVLKKEIGEEGKFTILNRELGKAKLNIMQFDAAPIPVAPTWAFHGNRLVLALMPQAVTSAIDRVASADAKSMSILANDDFVRGRKLLPDKLVSCGYNDTARGVASFYGLGLLGGIAGVSAARSVGIDIDASMLPGQQAVCRGLYGDVTGMSVLDDGFLQSTHGPLPVSVPALGSLASTSMLVSILLPSLSRARVLSKRVVSSSNLRGIGTACFIYAYEHQEHLPPDLQTLIDAGQLTEKQLMAPNGPGERSYKYVPGLTLKMMPPEELVVAYEDWPGIEFEDDGRNVLFLDGHVEIVVHADFQRLLERTQQARSQSAGQGAQSP